MESFFLLFFLSSEPTTEDESTQGERVAGNLSCKRVCVGVCVCMRACLHVKMNPSIKLLLFNSSGVIHRSSSGCCSVGACSSDLLLAETQRN